MNIPTTANETKIDSIPASIPPKAHETKNTIVRHLKRNPMSIRSLKTVIVSTLNISEENVPSITNDVKGTANGQH